MSKYLIILERLHLDTAEVEWAGCTVGALFEQTLFGQHQVTVRKPDRYSGRCGRALIEITASLNLESSSFTARDGNESQALVGRESWREFSFELYECRFVA